VHNYYVTRLKALVHNDCPGKDAIEDAAGGNKGDFTADLNETKSTTRAGHRNAGNKQLHEEMKKDPNLRKQIEEKYGDDAFDRTSTSGSGRKNPKGADWHHDSKNKNDLNLMEKGEHKNYHKENGKKGGWSNFYK